MSNRITMTEVGMPLIGMPTITMTSASAVYRTTRTEVIPEPTEAYFQFDVTPLDSVYKLKY